MEFTMRSDPSDQYEELEKCQEVVVDAFDAAVASLIRHGQKVTLQDLGGLMDTLADALHGRAKPHLNWLESNNYEVGDAPYPNDYKAYIEREHTRMVSEIDAQKLNYTNVLFQALRVPTNPATYAGEL